LTTKDERVIEYFRAIPEVFSKSTKEASLMNKSEWFQTLLVAGQIKLQEFIQVRLLVEGKFLKSTRGMRGNSN
jgi:hypothetical protein